MSFFEYVEPETAPRQFPSSQVRLDLARMNYTEDDHHKEHQYCIEDIKEYLMPKNIPIITLNILYNPKH